MVAIVDSISFLVENVSMPEDIKKEIFELSRLNAIDLNKLAQMKAAKRHAINQVKIPKSGES